MKATNETALVKSCLQLLSLRRIYAWRNNSGAFVLGKGASRRFFRAGLVGSSDILAVLPPTGTLLVVEAKVGKNKPTPAQEAFMDAVRQAGGLALCVYSLDELNDALDVALAKRTT